MEKTDKLAYGGARAKAGFFAVCLAVYWACAAYAGMPVWAPVLAVACVALCLVLPGVLAAHLLREAYPPAMHWPVALVCGMGFFAVATVLAVRLWPPLLWVAGLLACVCLVLLARKRGWRAVLGLPTAAEKQKKRAKSLWPNWLALLGILLVAYALAGVLPNRLPVDGATVIHQDVLWNTGNAAALARSFPPWEPRFLGLRLQYHFFTDLVCAGLATGTGIGCFEAGQFCLQPLMLAGLLAAAQGFGKVFFASEKKALAYAAFLFFGAGSCAALWPLYAKGEPFDNLFIYHLLTNINGQTTATLLVLVFLGLFAHGAQKRFAGGFWPLALMAGVFALLCIAKGPAAAILLCAVVLVVACGLPAKTVAWRGGVALAGAMAALFGAAWLLLFSGGAQSSMWVQWDGTLLHGALAPFAEVLRMSADTGFRAAAIGSPAFWLIQAVLMLPGVMLVACVSIFKEAKRFFAIPPARLVCYFGGAGGTVAFFLFNHQSFSQLYFFFVAVVLLGAVAVQRWGVMEGWLKKLALTLAGLAVLGALGSYGGFAADAAQSVTAPKESQSELRLVTPEDWQAARWLRQNTAQTAIFATNRISSGGEYYGISNLYSALGQRQAHMEGYKYVESNMGIPWEMLQGHVEANAALFDPATPPEALLAICAERGITHLVYHAPSEGSDEALQMAGFALVFDGGGTKIYAAPG